MISLRGRGAWPPELRSYDALGSTDRVTDTNEGVSASYLYKAFGEQTDLSGENAAPNRLRWVGKLGYYFEADLNTYWLRARVYEPARGRFISRDPVREEANLYRWPGNSPVVEVDPSGRGREEGAYIVERCAGKQGKEWGCLAYFPRGWLNPLVTSAGGYTYVRQHTVEAENVKCECTKLLGLFGKRTCRLTLIHRHVVTQVPPFEHWSTVIIKDETTRIQKEPPATECVRLVAPEPHHEPGGRGGPGPGPPRVPIPRPRPAWPGRSALPPIMGKGCQRYQEQIERGHQPTSEPVRQSCIECCGENFAKCMRRARNRAARAGCSAKKANCIPGCDLGIAPHSWW